MTKSMTLDKAVIYICNLYYTWILLDLDDYCQTPGEFRGSEVNRSVSCVLQSISRKCEWR